MCACMTLVSTDHSMRAHGTWWQQLLVWWLVLVFALASHDTKTNRQHGWVGGGGGRLLSHDAMKRIPSHLPRRHVQCLGHVEPTPAGLHGKDPPTHTHTHTLAVHAMCNGLTRSLDSGATTTALFRM